MSAISAPGWVVGKGRAEIRTSQCSKVQMSGVGGGVNVASNWSAHYFWARIWSRISEKTNPSGILENTMDCGKHPRILREWPPYSEKKKTSCFRQPERNTSSGQVLMIFETMGYKIYSGNVSYLKNSSDGLVLLQSAARPRPVQFNEIFLPVALWGWKQKMGKQVFKIRWICYPE